MKAFFANRFLARSAKLTTLLVTASFGLAACCPGPVIDEVEPKQVILDQDNDGVLDEEDRCPTVPGKAEFSGCPDTDGDGIADDQDKCPKVAGIAEEQGCPRPDRDGDGVADSVDQCPDQPGPEETKGCPDSDGDGIPDHLDKCPDQAGTEEEQGCLPQRMRRFTGSIKGITFDSGKATIRKSSFKTLDDAAKVLSEFSRLRLEIQGHTDDQGDDDFNMQLSQERADAVKNYLVSKGIDADRIDAKGFGESQPVADNRKAAGRATNRRIEFKAIGRRGRPMPLPAPRPSESNPN